MKRTKPPFRADHVGSYLRSAAITEARAKRDKGQISAADLKKVEDQEIPKVIKKQGRAPVINDSPSAGQSRAPRTPFL